MEIAVYIIGGFLAGVATGLIGLSAAIIVAPLYATLLGMDAYVAIGIALASDIFASATSSFNYIKHKNIDLKRSWVLFASVIVAAIIGSYFSKDMSSYNMNATINIFVLILGIRFLVYPLSKERANKKIPFGKYIIFTSIFFGIIIGMICGYFGGGGGLSLLAVLTMLYKYDFKKAVGTSVFIMTFTALVASTTHILIMQTQWLPLVITSVAAFAGANISSSFANKINLKVLNYTIAIFLIIYGSILVILHFFM
jgi:hypothetical protein